MSDAHKAEIIERARELMGAPRPNADAAIALLNCWDMGYRSPFALAHMAHMMMSAPQGSEEANG